MQGLGPVNVGSEKWNIAKIKEARIKGYILNL